MSPLVSAATMRVLVVDDETLARSRLATLLTSCRNPSALLQAQAGSAVQAMQYLQHQTFDVVLLDIHMPGSDGLQLASVMRTLPNPPAVVFVTAHTEHALQAFELDAADYLTKPVRLERLQSALQKVERLLQIRGAVPVENANQDVIIIQDRNRTERLPLADVIYFKAELKYITVRTVTRNYIIEGSLNELEDRYADRFMRIHRNALIAKRAARALEKHHDSEEGDGWALRLDGIPDVLFVSRRQLAMVKEMLARQ